MQRYFFALFFAVFLLVANEVSAKVGKDTLVLNRIFSYAEGVDTSCTHESHSYAYYKFLFKTEKRNVFLMAVPTMYGVAHGGSRMFAGEFYDQVDFHAIGNYEARRLLDLNTIPHRRKTIPTLLNYLTPEIYSETILKDQLLSPFHRRNKNLYRYKLITLYDGTVVLLFKPKVENTQLVSGRAIVDGQTGRVVSTDLQGEYDMVHFKLTLEMGSEGVYSLLPERAYLSGVFRFMGSKFSANYVCYYGLKGSEIPEPHSVADQWNLLEKVRPEPLSNEERQVLEEYVKGKEVPDTIGNAAVPMQKDSCGDRKNLAKTVFWDILGDHMLNRTKSSFGNNDQGYLRISPFFNPLYLGYSNRKGVVYKFNIRSGYAFTPNRDITLQAKGGYSFKQKQFYLSLPLHFNYNKRRHAFLAVEYDYGRHIYNSEISKEIDEGVLDSLEREGIRMDYFRDMFINVYNNYDISDRWSFNVGFTFHRRQAIHQRAFKDLGRPSGYRSTAPRLEVQYRPLGWKGPIVTFDYERGIKGVFGSDAEYERWEIDGSYIHNLGRLRTVSMRAGGGAYSYKSGKQYFLDFTNFRENNIPGGWNDDWSGEFELLRAAWYNSSRYYVRANTTYESPVLFMSHLPLLGHFVEMERIYLGAVMAEELKPYVEIGLGFTTRWITLGGFIGNKNGHFERVGGRIGIELFRKW